MKFTRTLALTLFTTLLAFSVVTYTACKKDLCKDVVCLNGGTCFQGVCQCPAGFEGDTCQVRTGGKFVSRWWRVSAECTSPLEGVEYFFLDTAKGWGPTVLVANFNGIGITGTITSPTTAILLKTVVGQGRTLDSGRLTYLPESDRLSANFYFTHSGNGQSTAISCTGTYKPEY